MKYNTVACCFLCQKNVLFFLFCEIGNYSVETQHLVDACDIFLISCLKSKSQINHMQISLALVKNFQDLTWKLIKKSSGFHNKLSWSNFEAMQHSSAGVSHRLHTQQHPYTNAPAFNSPIGEHISGSESPAQRLLPYTTHLQDQTAAINPNAPTSFLHSYITYYRTKNINRSHLYRIGSGVAHYQNQKRAGAHT